ncbi:MAG: acyltransferase domain-containing protein [Eubacterium sp.]
MIDCLNLDEKLKQKVIDLAYKDRVNLLLLAEKCNEGNYSCLKTKDDLTRLAVVIMCLENTRVQYERLKIDDKVLFDTMSDISIWCSNNDNKGLKNYGWIKNHLSCELFRLGRLQFQIFNCNNPTLNYKRLPFSFGEKMIYVHIPQGERLIYDDCVSSLKQAKAFFSKHFPDFEYRYFFCESWLLYGDNDKFMPQDSNIIKFASLFDVRYSVKDDSQAIERIFGKRQLFKSRYPESTTLQKNAKTYMQNGGKLGIGIGVISADSI